MSFATVAVVGGAASLASGLGQVLFSGKKKKEKALEAHAANAPKWGGSGALDQYYQQSLQQANTGAQQSSLYKQQMNQANRMMGAGVAGLNSRQGGQGDVARLVQTGADLSGKAIAGAEQQKERRFGQLGQVTQAKAAQDYQKFNINQQKPWETKYNLLAAKAAKAAEQQQAGFANIAGGAQAAMTAGIGGMKP